MKITCDIIRDLIPLYTDGVLSRDSESLVREHLGQCSECMEYCRRMSADFVVEEKKKKALAEKESLKKLKRAIVCRRMAACVAAALCVILAAAGGHYFYYEKEAYVSMEEGEISVDENEITGKGIYSTANCFSPDQTAYFFCGTSTAYSRSRGEEETDNGSFTLDMTNFLVLHPEKDTETTWPDTLTEVYYLSEEGWRKLDDYFEIFFSSGRDEEEITAAVEELKADSFLLCSKNEDSLVPETQ